MKSKLKAIVASASLAAVSLSLAACGTGGGDGAKAAGSASAGANTVNITMENKDGKDVCTTSATEVAAGPTTFNVENKSASSIIEVELLQENRILGEKENLAPGLAPVSFSVNLDGGDYELYCPNGDPEEIDFKVTGEAVKPSGDTRTLLEAGAKDYGAYVQDQVGYMVDATKKLSEAVDSGDVDAAKKAYATARPFYEKAESAVEQFGNPKDNSQFLDYLIDMRASNIDKKVGWSGFHAVERDLWKSGKITDGTKKYAKDLAANTVKLDDIVKKLTYTPEDLANGAAGLLEEVQTNKITGEEEAFSHLDLLDFQANVEGAAQAFSNLKPGLEKIDVDLVKQIDEQFKNVDTTLDGYRDKSVPGGFKAWTPELRKSDSKKLSQSVQKLQDPLAKLAEKIATHQG
ncbi:EfeM/EfeO family lipoprotein [Brevibacterium sp. 91QC2O2]|uniref:iron uptake system protein EfeO n=1 Tax=Brevibacterium TaxID=1696 RepID=UPI00211CD051|nr:MULTISPECIES: iron uptake system protein EfeO [unclassified Brevibacterium]MCQ9368530.1 EfeM/EfeO family lipoprotein [Brevibacterium sp. 91QC2O2]MCQ9386927.1 EfeM/EfeO family lipoprotein [Brevibacterium sp. 68QC2CO]